MHIDSTWEKRGRRMILRAVIICLFASVLASEAQTAVDFHKIAGGGGGTSTNGLLAISGTIGQPDAGTFAIGNLTIVGGFWGGATNQSPRAATLVYTRAGNGSLNIKVADMLTNCYDPQGLPLTLQGVSASTNNASLTTNSADIFYANANNVDDAFNYTIANNQGATSTGLILIQVVSVNSQSTIVSLQPAVPGPGTNTLTFAGIPGYQYITQFATNLTTSPWLDFSTNTAGTNGLWQVLDPNAITPERYYRVRSP